MQKRVHSEGETGDLWRVSDAESETMLGREARRILLRKGYWKVVKMGELYLWSIVESGMSGLLVIIVPGVGVIERGEGETEWEGFLSRREGTLLVSVSGVEMDIRRWEKSRSGSGLQRDSYQSGEEKKESERCG